MCCYARGARKEQKAGSSPDYSQTVALATNGGEPIAAASSSSFDYVAEINRTPL